MKHSPFSFLLLCSFVQQTFSLDQLPGPTFSGKYERHHTNFRKLELIEKLDGKEGFFDALAIQDAFKVIHIIFEIQYGKHDSVTKKRTGLYTLDNDLITLKDLVKAEQALIQNKVDQSDARWTAINKALRLIKDDFNAKIKALERADRASNAVAQGIQKKLIVFFLEDQKIKDSILQDQEDKAAFDSASATDFFRFLNNLKHFLEDLTDSCTVAHKNYKDLVKKAHESHKS